MATLSYFRKALTANDTGTTFGARIPQVAVPSGAGIFDLSAAPYGLTTSAPSFLHLLPFGTAANDKTFSMRVWGWSPAADVVGGLYIPFLLADLGVVLGNIDGSAIAASTFLADTITLTTGIPAGPFSGLLNTGTDLPASITIHTLGAKYIDFDFDADAGGAASTNANCYWRLLTFE